MNPILKESADMLIEHLATKLKLKLNDVIKENLPNWQKVTPKEKKLICQSIARYWLRQEIEEKNKK